MPVSDAEVLASSVVVLVAEPLELAEEEDEEEDGEEEEDDDEVESVEQTAVSGML